MDLLQWIFVPIQPFIWHPERIAAICAFLLLAFVFVLSIRRFPSWPLLIAAVVWGSFALWEWCAKAKGWDIRVDLFLIYPVLVVVTAWGRSRLFTSADIVGRLTRRWSGRAEARGSCLAFGPRQIRVFC